MPVKFLIMPRTGLGIEPLRVTPHALLERRVDMNLDELVGADKATNHIPLGPIGRNERADHDQSGIDHQLRDFARAPDIFDPISLGEAEVAVEAVSDVVAVQQHRMMRHREQLLLDEVGNGRLAGA